MHSSGLGKEGDPKKYCNPGTCLFSVKPAGVQAAAGF